MELENACCPNFNSSIEMKYKCRNTDEWGVFVYFVVNAFLRRYGVWNFGHTPLVFIIRIYQTKTVSNHKPTATMYFE